MITPQTATPHSAQVLRELNPDLDPVDFGILQRCADAYARRQEAQIGDFVELADGAVPRFTYDWGDILQTSSGEGSFHLSPEGASYSGALDPGVAKDTLIDTGRTRDGRFWFFRHNHMRAHNGVEVRIPCKLWRARPHAHTS